MVSAITEGGGRAAAQKEVGHSGLVDSLAYFFTQIPASEKLSD